MVKQVFNRQKQFTCDVVTITPSPDMSFHDVFHHIQTDIFSNMRGFKSIIAVALFHGDHGEFKASTTSDAPQEFYDSILLGCQMETWLRCSMDSTLLEHYAKHEAATQITGLQNNLYEQKCQDASEIQNICAQITTRYIDFLEGIAEEVFAGPLYTQLLWINALNNFQDEIGMPDTPLKRIGTKRLSSLIHSSTHNRNAEILRTKSVDFEAYTALKAVDDVLRKCVIAFQIGNTQEGSEHIRSIHPGALQAQIQCLEERYSLKVKAPKNKI